MTRAKKNPTCARETMWHPSRAMVYRLRPGKWEAILAGDADSRAFPTHAEALAYALNEGDKE